jgi:hypothetical protein
MNTRIVKNQVYITKVSDDIIYSLSTDNYEEFTRLVNKNNVNDIIDNKNGYNALHHAIRANNNKMIDYLLSIGADPYIKTGSNSSFSFIIQEDAFDLSLKFQNKHIITYELNENKKKNSELQKTISTLEKKILNLDTNNKYLVNSVDDLIFKNNLLKKDYNSLKTTNLNSNKLNNSLTASNLKLDTENKELKKKVSFLDETLSIVKKENETLLTNNKSLKRKFDSLEESYCGLLNKTRK